MENTLLIQQLNTFSSSEWRRWEQFVYSDYHCQNKYVRQLAKIIRSSHKKQKPLYKEAVWKQLFPTRPYSEAKLNNYTSDLLNCSHAFLIQESFKKKKGLQFDLLQQQLIVRGLVQQAERTAKKWDKHLNDSLLQNPDALYEQFRYHYLQDQLTLRQSKRTFGIHLQQKNLEFDRFYLLQQLIHHAELLNRRNIVKGDYQLAHLDGVMRRYDENEQGGQNIPSIEICVKIVKMLLGKDAHNNFSSIAILANEHHSCFTTEENKIIYNYLFNFCVKQINSGNTDYYPKIFKLYQALMQKDLLLQNGTLSQWTYTNIITTGIRLKEWEWTEKFLKTYKLHLPSSVQHNAYHYNLAAFYFERHDYQQAFIPLNELDYKDAFYQMAAKTIQLKIYYRLDETEAFEALEAASRQFIFRNKQLSDYQQTSNINFIKLLKKIYNYRQNHKRWTEKKQNLRLASLMDVLNLPTYHLAHKDWLGVQLEELDSGD